MPRKPPVSRADVERIDGAPESASMIQNVLEKTGAGDLPWVPTGLIGDGFTEVQGG